MRTENSASEDGFISSHTGIHTIGSAELSSMGKSTVLMGSTSAVLTHLANLRSALTAREREVVHAFRFDQHRDDYVAAHLLVRQAAAFVLDGIAPGDIVIEQRCDHCGGAHGKPFVAGKSHITVSWSHQNGVVCAGAAEFPIGVDIERPLVRTLDAGVAALALGERELDAWRLLQRDSPSTAEKYLLRQWVRKESMIKLGLLDLDSMKDWQFHELPSIDDMSGFHVRSTWCGGMLITDWHSDRLGTMGAVVSLPASAA